MSQKQTTNHLNPIWRLHVFVHSLSSNLCETSRLVQQHKSIRGKLLNKIERVFFSIAVKKKIYFSKIHSLHRFRSFVVTLHQHLFGVKWQSGYKKSMMKGLLIFITISVYLKKINRRTRLYITMSIYFLFCYYMY